MADRIVVMKDGYIQQIGSPKELFSDPANKFVGSFIGSPAMNFIYGTYENGTFTAEFANIENNPLGLEKFAYKVTKEQAEFLKPYEGKRIILGVRPEDIYVKGDTNNHNPSESFKVDCDYVELLGYDLVLYFYINGHKIVAKTDEKTNIKTGDSADMCLDNDKVYFFDAETELRIK